jgi:hypothetical protein
MISPAQLVLILSFACGLIGYGWPHAMGDTLWFKCQAGMIFGICSAFYLYARGIDRATKAMVQVFAWCAFGNLLDELFFDPEKVGFWEYAVATLGCLTSWMNYNGVTWKGSLKSLWHRTFNW